MKRIRISADYPDDNYVYSTGILESTENYESEFLKVARKVYSIIYIPEYGEYWKMVYKFIMEYIDMLLDTDESHFIDIKFYSKYYKSGTQFKTIHDYTNYIRIIYKKQKGEFEYKDGIDLWFQITCDRDILNKSIFSISSHGVFKENGYSYYNDMGLFTLTYIPLEFINEDTFYNRLNKSNLPVSEDDWIIISKNKIGTFFNINGDAVITKTLRGLHYLDIDIIRY